LAYIHHPRYIRLKQIQRRIPPPPEACQQLKGVNVMRLRNLFIPVTDMNAEQLQSFIDANEEGSFTLLDVRQPSEYETARIPGSKLLPLPSLDDGLNELDPQKTVIAY
jgi:hypothetical protein